MLKTGATLLAAIAAAILKGYGDADPTCDDLPVVRRALSPKSRLLSR